jgi:hypothetical protein
LLTLSRFLLANLQLVHVLGETAQANMRKALKSLPPTVEDAYNQILTRIRMSEYSSSTAFRTLGWIFHAKRPLRMDELREALIVQDKENPVDLDEMDMEDLLDADILEICQSLVVHEESSGVVRFSHPTIQGFLESQVLESLPVVDLARTCLAYLQFDEFQGGPCVDSEAVEKRVQKYKFSRYVAQSWGIHTRGKPENEPDIQLAVLSLLASENKRASMLQLEAYANSGGIANSWGIISFTKGQTLLHVIAKNGLATICQWVLSGRIKGNDTYALEVDI